MLNTQYNKNSGYRIIYSIDLYTSAILVRNTNVRSIWLDIYKTRMKTSISSKDFCSITDRQTDKIFTE